MPRDLPATPNLDHLRKEAKSLLRAALRGEIGALDRLRAVGAFSPSHPPQLADAQHLLAREYGFENWASLKHHIIIASSATDPLAAFAAAVRGDDAQAAGAILARHPMLRARLNDPLPDAAFGGIAMTCAASAKNRDMVDLLLSAGADIDAKSDWWAGGFSALDSAEPDFAAYLIERGATITPYAAARLGMRDNLERSVHGDPDAVHSRGGDGQTPLHVAANVEIALLLIEAGAEIDALDVDHESTPAMYAVRERTDVTRFLMSRGCRTDILMASATGDAASVRDFLERDPSSVRTTVNDRWFPRRNPRSGGTIYRWTLGGNKSAHAVARDFGHQDIYNLLMERTPPPLRLAVALDVGDDALVDTMNRDQPALIAEFTDDERVKLVLAAESNRTRTVGAMLRAGWPVDTKSEKGTTALHWASFHGNREMIAEILRRRPALELTDDTFNGTALGWALHGSVHGWHADTGDYPGAVAALLDAGARLPASSAKEVVASGPVLTLLHRRGLIKES